MKHQWIIDCVGTSEDDEAYLRLLLRSARKQVSDEWIWGSASEADLLLMDGKESIDDDAIRRASQPGVARAQLIDAAEAAPAGLFLRKPFHKEALAALLNEVARSGPVAVAAGPDAHGLAHAESDPQPVPSKIADPAVDENLMRSLLHYLPKRVLGGPAQIALPDAPTLVIDPESRMFWANGILPALEPYVRQPLRFGDWKPLADAALDDARRGLDARPYAYLTWLDSFIHSRGNLSRRFDVEGTYRLTKRLELANDYPRALRISAQMTQPRRLDAIARASGAELGEVFDVVNAYEAIGYLEWTRPTAAPRKG